MRRGQSPPERFGSVLRLPWSRILLTMAIVGPALWIGGVPPEVVPVFLVVVALACTRLCLRSSERLRVPWIALLGVLAIGATLLQWLPLGLRGLLAPGLDAEVSAALAHAGTNAWPSLSATPGDAAVETSRLVGLTVLCIAAAQLSWRATATMVAAVGTLVALVGFAHAMAGTALVYGWYQPQEVLVHGPATVLLGTFVNPNHQSGLLLLGLFAAAGLAADQRRLGLDARDPSKADRHADACLAAIAAISIQLPALLLSLSRGAIVALMLVGPFALWLGLRRRRSMRRSGPARPMSRLRWLVLAGMATMLLVVSRHGAWQELATLGALVDPSAELDVKVRMLGEAPALLALSPVLGIGPGAFVDLFGTVDSQPGAVVFTHLESAPLALVLRWGPVAGSIVALGLAAWWLTAMWHGGRSREATARRIVLLGVLALGLQNLADFSLEFLGVAAPAAALVGALSPPRWLHWSPRSAHRVVLGTTVIAVVVAVFGLPSTWSHRERQNEALHRGETTSDALLRVRPLDGRLHRLIARRAAADERWLDALAHAVIATHLRPGSIDAWLLRATAEHQTGAHDSALASTRHALGLLRTIPDPALVQWLVQRYPRPEDLLAVAPEQAESWRWLAEGLLVASPHHAAALAAARTQTHPGDPTALRMRSQLARQHQNPALALHHARLLQQLAPEELTSHLAVVAALRSFSPPRHEEARDVLEQALEHLPPDDTQGRALLSEQLLRTLITLGDRPSLERGRQLADELLRRPAERTLRRRWEALARELSLAEQHLDAPPP